MERLQKVIAASGVTSRRKAEELIVNGKVRVNGIIIKELGTKVSSSDEIEVNGVLISKEEKEYYLLNKPRGVVTTTSDDKNRRTVIDLIDTDARIYPVGRLDYDTTGVLILTNDGEFANILMHPKNKVEKVYMAKLEGIITGEAINKLKDGVVIDGVKVIPSRVKLRKVDPSSNTCIVQIIIHEGKNHQVKKMFSEVGYSVEKLKRERVAFFTLDKLKSGEYRKLTTKEVAKVYSLAK
ncbi:MAG: rRNA pseudouridine synthase [Firmicutes bacterium]|nr:rRNA pseudouridine synthase [Bacillota bacterium]